MIKLPDVLPKLNDKVTLVVAIVFVILGLVLDKRIEESQVGTILLAIGALFLILTMIKRRGQKSRVSEDNN